MRIVFAVIGVLFVLGGIGSCAVAKGAIHEIGGLVSLLIGSLFVVSAFLIEQMNIVTDKINALGRLLIEIRDRLPPPTSP